jgi:adenylate cyclase
MGMILLYMGDLRASMLHLETAVGLNPEGSAHEFSPYTGHSSVTSLAYLARVVMLMGKADRALKYASEALRLAESVGVAPSIAQAAGIFASIRQSRREVGETEMLTQRTLAEAKQHELPYWEAFGEILQGWLVSQHESREQGIAQIQDGLDLYGATGSTLGVSFFDTLLADMYVQQGDVAGGLKVIAEAELHIESTGERYYAAEVHRLKGLLLLEEGKPWAALAAEVCFREALDTARQQGAALWMLRAAVDLATLLRDSGRAEEGRDLLVEAYSAFDEGLDTPDLVEARELLKGLAG